MTRHLFVILFELVAVLMVAAWAFLDKSRKYKSGTKWCFWRWTEVDSEYIVRLHVVKTPWFAICLHWIKKPDEEPWLHDHPVSFLSIILRGQYAEIRGGYYRQTQVKLRRWLNWFYASEGDQHRIVLTRKNTLTLCLMGPKMRDWGFNTPAGWIMWKDYYALLRAGFAVRTEAFWKERFGKGTFRVG